MFLERYLTDILTNHFGHVVENVDSDQIRVSAWNGELKLHDLTLKKDALMNFLPEKQKQKRQCPVEIVHGKIGTLHLRIPWKLIRSQFFFFSYNNSNTSEQASSSFEDDEDDGQSRASLLLQDVHILISPQEQQREKEHQQQHQEDQEQDQGHQHQQTLQDDEQNARVQKEQRVQASLDSQLMKLVAQSSSSSSSAPSNEASTIVDNTTQEQEQHQQSSRLQWLRDRITSLLSTISVRVENIHIRYEDPGTAMGFTWTKATAPPQKKQQPQPQLLRYRDPFAVGITLHQFSVLKQKQQKQQDSQLQQHNSNAQDHIQVAAAAKDLAVYWDSSSAVLLAETKSPQQSQEQQQQERRDDDGQREGEQGEGEQEQQCVSGETKPFQQLQQHRHTYVLHPVSPSIQFNLVPEEDKSTRRDSTFSTGSTTTSPCTMSVIFPPCQFTIARNMLEDIAYIRTSFSVWTDAKKGLLSESSLRRLAKLRPSTSPLDSPRSWWKYACQATILFQRSVQRLQNSSEQEFEDEDDDEDVYFFKEEAFTNSSKTQTPSPQQMTRPTPKKVIKQQQQRWRRRRQQRGWLGLAQALGKRRQYISFYEIILDTESRQMEERMDAHESLLSMEDQLSLDEIVAFRIATYYYSAKSNLGKATVAKQENNNRAWSGWIPSMGRNNPGESSAEATDTKSTLSLEYRCHMYEEMANTLEKRDDEKREWQLQYKNDYAYSVSVTDTSAGASASESTSDFYSDQHKNTVLWKISLLCREMSLQVNDQQRQHRHRSNRFSRLNQPPQLHPVVRLSCVTVMEQLLYEDSSWDLDCSIASLAMVDLTRIRKGRKSSISSDTADDLPFLIGPKTHYQNTLNAEDNEIFVDCGSSINSRQTYRRSVRIKVRKSKNWNEVGKKLGSTTKTQIRLFPMEVIYSTVPVEALSRVLATVQTPELSDDYHRMASKVQQWRERQKKRLLEALAHKEKKIIVDVDVHAPVLLIPENTGATRREPRHTLTSSTRMLIIDLGRIQFFNEDVTTTSTDQLSIPTGNYDDHWRLVLSNIQCYCSSTTIYQHTKTADKPQQQQHQQKKQQQQLVEPFSLDFVILTKITSDENVDEDPTEVQVVATLPRLSFNLTSSAIRLVLHLQNQWREQRRRKELQQEQERQQQASAETQHQVEGMEAVTTQARKIHTRISSKSPANSNIVSSRKLEFRFSAPLITLRLENDVDGRDCYNNIGFHATPPPTTQLVDLALRGIGCHIVQEFSSKDSSAQFVMDARLRSLDVVDLYQGAGSDYALLLSSLSPELLLGRARAVAAANASSTMDSFVRNNNEQEKEEQLSWQKVLSEHHHPIAIDSTGNTMGQDLVCVHYHSSTTRPASAMNVDENTTAHGFANEKNINAESASSADDTIDTSENNNDDNVVLYDNNNETIELVAPFSIKDSFDKYESETRDTDKEPTPAGVVLESDKLSISFHELYVEWNPETIAAIHKAMKLPIVDNISNDNNDKDKNETRPYSNDHGADDDSDKEVDEEMFFDAVEDYFYDASLCESDSQSLSSDSDLSSLFSPGDMEPNQKQPSLPSVVLGHDNTHFSSLSNVAPILRNQEQRLSQLLLMSQRSLAIYDDQYDDYEEEENIEIASTCSSNSKRPFEIEFKLSKLRMNFNKESRHRRLITAEMDGTWIRYISVPDLSGNDDDQGGGSKTTARIGNLTFTDPASVQSETLYGQILGLKSDASMRSAASLLEMEIVINPRKRKILDKAEWKDFREMQNEEHAIESVSVCFDESSMEGCDYHLKAHFSPMRFVYLQQLWCEIADYFFDGIIGSEVWGKTAPEMEDESVILNENSVTTNLFNTSFTKFDITIDTPVVLFPVAYCSTEFLRLNAASISVSNQYNCHYLSTSKNNSYDKNNDQQQVMWFNNCTISIQDLRLFNWSEKELSESKQPVLATISLRWPTGPLAFLQTPKWNVNCKIGSLDMALRKEDYALLQNMVSHNIGEDSRNLDEWTALQNLPPIELLRYKEKIMVHFGYDKKDVAPTTYSVSLTVPSITFSFVEGDEEGRRRKTVAVACCTELRWELIKLKDRVTQQKITCDVVLKNPNMANELHSETMLSPSRGLSLIDNTAHAKTHRNSDDNSFAVPEISYTSTSQPNGDNVKTLEIVDACIHMIYPSWRNLTAFFQGLPEPCILTREEVSLSVQVGDRWYRIGGNNFPSTDEMPNDHVSRQALSDTSESRNFSWINDSESDRKRLFQSSNTSTGQEQQVQQTTTSSTFATTDHVQQQNRFQFRVLLTSPCIVVSSTMENRTSVVLRLSHLDFLHDNNGKEFKICKSFFLHDLEVYTSSTKQNYLRHQGSNPNNDDYSEIRDDNLFSLIHPICIAGRTELDCSDAEFSYYSVQISADVLKARAAFSDMSVALDVWLTLLNDSREQNQIQKNLQENTSKDTERKNLSANKVDDIDVGASRQLVMDGCSSESIDKEVHSHDKGAGREAVTAAAPAKTSSPSSSSLPDQLKPTKMICAIEWDGFELLVVDDSGRHFAGSQELIALSVGEINFLRDESPRHQFLADEDVPNEELVCSMSLRLLSVDLFDCLQSQASPFRLVATNRSGAIRRQTATNTSTDHHYEDIDYGSDPAAVADDFTLRNLANPQRQMNWKDFTMTKSTVSTSESSCFGFTTSRQLIERTNISSFSKSRNGVFQKFLNTAHNLEDHPDLIELNSFIHGDLSKSYEAKMRSFALQWNPSTIIALQRFLGRLLKQARRKAVQVFDEDLGSVMGGDHTNDSVSGGAGAGATSDPGGSGMDADAAASEQKESGIIPVKAVFNIENLTVCLNKEHQQRRLLQLTLSGSKVNLEQTQSGVSIAGEVGDFNAWDCDVCEILPINRSVLKVAVADPQQQKGSSDGLYSSRSFLEFRYKTFTTQSRSFSALDVDIPKWVQGHVFSRDDDEETIHLDIDDYLVVSIATVEFTYLRERTEEILDYLSNGLPGKGMGATSRAARGFLKKRIKTKSFLEIHVDAPTVVIPQHELTESGFAMRLGDLNLNSWFEEGCLKGRINQMRLDGNLSTAPSRVSISGEEQLEWFRMVSLSLIGLYCGVFKRTGRNASLEISSFNKPINLSIVLQKPTWHSKALSLRCKLSLVDMTVTYLDYVYLRAVLRDNIGRKIDTDKWDNVEKAYWMEEDFSDTGSAGLNPDESISGDFSTAVPHTGNFKRVEYSSNARHVRYGTSKSKKRNIATNEEALNVEDGTATVNKTKKSSVLDLQFRFDGLSLKLRRNDPVEGVSDVDSETSAAFEYDMTLLRVQIVEMSISNNDGGDLSFHLSLFRIGLFDLGDRGRLVRERFLLMTEEGRRKSKRRDLRLPCAFAVLVEGYSPSEKQQRSTRNDSQWDGESDENVDAQLVVTVDRCPASSAGTIGIHEESFSGGNNDDSKVTVARVVINYLSVNALIRPFREMVSFLSCSWPAPQIGEDRDTNQRRKQTIETNDPLDANGLSNESKDTTVSASSSALQIKLVAHYPRIFFVADESDPHSRALVLRGLAVVNAGLTSKNMIDENSAAMNKTIKPSEYEDLRCTTAVDAQLHSLESYINPDVDSALRLKHRHAEMLGTTKATLPNASQSSLFFDLGGVVCDDNEEEEEENDNHGVALLEPVTTGVEFVRTNRSRFPTKRSLFINIEPVSTMLSFEDLQLIEAVLNRWSSSRSDTNDLDGDYDLGRGSTSSIDRTRSDSIYSGIAIVDSSEFGHGQNCMLEKMSEEDETVRSYKVTFTSQRLGLGLRKEGDFVVVDEVRDSQHNGIVGVGDKIFAIDDNKLLTNSLHSVVDKLSSTPRPTTLTFIRSSNSIIAVKQFNLVDPVNPVGSVGQDGAVGSVGADVATSTEKMGSRAYQNNSPRPNSKYHNNSTRDDTSFLPFNVLFHRGINNGLYFEKCMVGNIPIITQIDQFLLMEAVAVSDNNFDSTNSNSWRNRSIRLPRTGAIIVELDGISSASLEFTELLSMIKHCTTKSNDSYDNRSNEQTGAAGGTYSISFLELDSSVWGCVDSFDLSASGAVLTFIDDLKGRDMPLLRGNLTAVEAHLKRGIGIETNILDSEIPWILQDTGADSQAETNDSILKLSAISRCSIEYYHPQIAVWEPFLEPAQLCFVLEWQAANVLNRRPAQLAIEMSDQILRSQAFVKHAVQSKESIAQFVCLNCSDAAVEVFAKALSEWNNWRENLILPEDDESVGNLNNGQNMNIDKSGDLFSTLHVNAPGRKMHKDDMTATEPGSVGQDVTLVDVSDRSSKTYRTKHVAAQKAAHAALVFAKKRGAGQENKSESSKPFVFRNRTGLSVAFVQQKRTPPYKRGILMQTKRGYGMNLAENTQFSVVGEYKGLEFYNSSEITELADGEDAKFNMEVVSASAFIERDMSSGGRQVAKRVRTYEGQFHYVTVCIQAVAGIMVEPITNLQVFKAGSTVRQLSVKKEYNTDSARSPGDTFPGESVQYSVPVVWKVEIEDNRRILTLSSAVRVVSLGLTTSIEVGAQTNGNMHLPSENDSLSLSSASKDDSDSNSEADFSSTIQSIGVAQPENPFYLPLWLALRLETVQIHIRPRSARGEYTDYLWGRKSVLEFSPVSNADKWAWKETFTELESIRCTPVNNDQGSVWLSCYVSSLLARDRERRVKGTLFDQREIVREPNEVLSVSVDSGLTLRNMLPMCIEWELAHSTSGNSCVVDGSWRRNQQSDHTGGLFGPSFTTATPALKSGECAEVFACNFKVESVTARFRRQNDKFWSVWAPVSSPVDRGRGDDEIDEEQDDLLGPGMLNIRQMNVQLKDDFGIPLTFGVRVVPKLAQSLLEGSSGSLVFGVEVIIFAELWIRNLTTLPLCFGCPASQIYATVEGPGTDNQSASGQAKARFSAEAALMEIASVLELGERGTGLKTGGSNDENDDIYTLPNQECGSIVEEVFEYLQLESSTVKRRWWASEDFRHMRENITIFTDDGNNWNWVDEAWKVDCAGCVSVSSGGWESSRSLTNSGERAPFGGKRGFNASHLFRRRRWFRERSSSSLYHDYGDTTRHYNDCKFDASLFGGLQAFHQPINDSFSVAQRKARQRRRRRKKGREGGKGGKGTILDETESRSSLNNEEYFEISMKCGGGNWSKPALLASSGACNGVVRVFASRWPTLTKATNHSKKKAPSVAADNDRPLPSFGFPPLKTDLYELCYNVADVDDEWGEFSKLMLVSARFQVRNDSATVTVEVKQTGGPDEKAISLAPGEIAPFYWADFRLPELVSVRPQVRSVNGRQSYYRWSGGFDACNLGLTAIRVRQCRGHNDPAGLDSKIYTSDSSLLRIRSIRTLVEIRPGTGGTGINVSFKEEDPGGNGSLFRIENGTPFPIWLAQDGVLANPSTVILEGTNAAGTVGSNSHAAGVQADEEKLSWTDDHADIDGDLLRPSDQMSFALDVPFRQGKYAGRKAATMKELLRVRVGLAPLSSRAGIETTKVIGLVEVGENVRLRPTKLVSVLNDDLRNLIESVRVLGITTVDGPTRVLKFCLMQKDVLDIVFANSFIETVSYGTANSSNSLASASIKANMAGYFKEIVKGANEAKILHESGKIPSEAEAKQAIFHGILGAVEEAGRSAVGSSPSLNQFFSFRAAFSGFLVSLIDSSPSEICTITMKNFNALARWDAVRTSDASLIMSVGWLQVDNHIPNAPFPVAVCPDSNELREKATENRNSAPTPDTDLVNHAPLLVIGIAFLPRHTSGILCLRSVTIAPRNLAIAADLAFLVRLEQYSAGIKMHFDPRGSSDVRSGSIDQKRAIPIPDIQKRATEMKGAAATGVGSQKLNFGELTILPCNIKLSVAPARALTKTQAALEGLEAAAIHQAVRKGDVRLLGNSSAVLGVKIGNKNTTALAVVRGVFKSIVVDALLRLNGASLNFSGVFLRNHITTGPQLTTYLLAHYLASLRHNVPALLGSLAAFGNPLGLIRGLGDGVSDFVTEPVKGLKKTVQELDPSFFVDGIARGTESLTRHAVGGFADSAALLTETFSKNMTVLTLDRRYAQKRDRENTFRVQGDLSSLTFVEGVESGMHKLVEGFLEGVKGVVKAPIRGAERRGFEGFAKGVGKGLLGLLVKPIIGISDAATDVMIGVKSSVEGGGGMHRGGQVHQIRPRRPMYGRDKVLRCYNFADAAAAVLMQRTKIGGENYLSHLDMGDRVALLSVRRLLMIGPNGEELLLLKFKHISKIEVRQIKQADGSDGWGLIVLLNTPRKNGSEIEVISCKERGIAMELCTEIKRGMNMAASEGHRS